MIWKEREEHQLQGLSTLLRCTSDRCSGETIPWEFPGLVMHDPLPCCELRHRVSCDTQGGAVLHGWLVVILCFQRPIAKEDLYLAFVQTLGTQLLVGWH